MFQFADEVLYFGDRGHFVDCLVSINFFVKSCGTSYVPYLQKVLHQLICDERCTNWRHMLLKQF